MEELEEAVIIYCKARLNINNAFSGKLNFICKIETNDFGSTDKNTYAQVTLTKENK